MFMKLKKRNVLVVQFMDVIYRIKNHTNLIILNSLILVNNSFSYNLECTGSVVKKIESLS